MLAQNFKTATDLRISGAQYDALLKVLGMLDRGEIPPDRFTMDTVWCGTAGCLCGWAQYISDGTAFRVDDGMISPPNRLDALFMMRHCGADLKSIRTDQAAMALRSFLTTGRPNWKEALAE